MKLSEAIRLGATMSDQCRGEYFDTYNGTCAVGSAMLAVGLEDEEDTTEEGLIYTDVFPLLLTIPGGCPECDRMKNYKLENIIIHLNDARLWARETIADWVETLESEQTSEKGEEQCKLQKQCVEV